MIPSDNDKKPPSERPFDDFAFHETRKEEKKLVEIVKQKQNYDHIAGVQVSQQMCSHRT